MADLTEEDELFEVSCEGDENENTETVYECSTCNMSFPNVDEHLKEYHNDDQTQVTNDVVQEIHVVEVLNEYDEENELDESEESEGMAFVVKNADGKFECKECFRLFISVKRFIAHIKTHGAVADKSIQKLQEYMREADESEDIFEEFEGDSGESTFRCKVCNTVFDSRKKMLLHYPIHKNVAAAHKKRNFVDTSEETFNCKLCNRSLNNAHEMKMHLSAHAENSAHGSKTKPDPPEKQRKKKGESFYPCQYCQKEFKRPHEKVKHERIHTGEKPYSCDICGKQFRVTYCLSLHKKNVHSEERPYVCSFEGCSKRFKSQSVYNHHLNTHGDAKNYKCTYCPKAFKTSVQLAGHKNTHTKPFACSICSRAFASLYAVKIHMEVHNNLDTNLKFTCKICSAQYGRVFALNDHVKTAHPGMENSASVEEMETAIHYVIEETATSPKGDDVDEVYSVVMDDE